MAVAAQPGIPYILFHVATGTSARIGTFYASALGAVTTNIRVGDAAAVAVAAGANGALLLFVEAPVDADAVTKQIGMHVCIYITHFEESFERVRPWTNPKVCALLCLVSSRIMHATL